MKADLDEIPGDPEQDLGDPVEVARQICLRQLEARPKSRAELAQVLAKKGVPEWAAEQMLGRLSEVGLVDDALFAQMWVRSRHRERGLARGALRQELHRKGIDADLAAEVLETIDSGDEIEAAKGLVRRKLGPMRNLPREAQTRRLVGMLARRGYSSSMAFLVVRDVLDAESSEN